MGGSNGLAAAGGAAAVFAFVAAAVWRHEHAAFGAGRRTILQYKTTVKNHFVCRALVVDLRRFGRCRNKSDGGSRISRWLSEIIGRNELPSKPSSDVIEHGFGIGNLFVSGIAGGLEARVDEFIDKGLERHAVLQSD